MSYKLIFYFHIFQVPTSFAKYISHGIKRKENNTLLSLQKVLEHFSSLLINFDIINKFCFIELIVECIKNKFKLILIQFINEYLLT